MGGIASPCGRLGVATALLVLVGAAPAVASSVQASGQFLSVRADPGEENEVVVDLVDDQFTVEDSSTYSQPWKGEVPLRRTDDHIYEYACHEGNYAMEGILRGARLEEARQKELAAKGGK